MSELKYTYQLERQTITKVFRLNVSNEPLVRFTIINNGLEGIFIDRDFIPPDIEKALRDICKKTNWNVPNTISILGNITPKTMWTPERR